MRFKPQLHRNLLENFGFECVMQFNEFNQKVAPKSEDAKDPTKEGEKVEKDTEDKENDKKSTEKDEIYKENNPDKKDEDDENKDVKTEKKEKADMPEINHCVCNICQKGFTSVWVLKAHEEEVHKEMVPFEFLEKIQR